MKSVLSIQSWVSYGHVGNASAMLPLHRLGVEVWAIHTVQFSNHTGYGRWRGPVFSGAMVRDIVLGLEEQGVLPRCDGLLSGYMGDREIGEAILDARARIRRANEAALYCCDPVIGDVDHGIYVRPGIAEFLRDHALPVADIATPNQFELEYLADRKIETLEDALAAVDRLHAIGPRVVLVTSLIRRETPDDRIELLVSAEGRAWLATTPRLALSVSGAGDAIAALFFVHMARTGRADLALSRSASSIFGLLEMTARAGASEIRLIDAQDEFVKPTHTIPVRAVR
ncbi:MAG: pyridoxal kinase PdxY [Alphaproteobacteria bacterium]|nr:pyridoxal kinase PdxY [Alphaproteobacteria bacterium]